MGGGPHEAREIGFEGPLVIIACAYLLTSYFIHDVRGVIIWGKKCGGCVKEALSAFCPECRAIGIVVEDRSTVHVNSEAIRPLHAIDLAAVLQIIRAIIDIVIAIDEADCRTPIPGFDSPVEVCRIACKASKAGGQLEECTIGYRVFVVVPVVKSEYLPFEPPTAACKIPSRSLSIPEIDRQLKPAWGAGRRRRKTAFSSRHGGKPPEALVIVPFVFLMCRHHIVIIRSHLTHERLIGLVVIRGIIRKVVVVEHGSPHSTCLPPVVWGREDSNGGRRVGDVARVVFHEPVGHNARCVLYGGWCL